MTTGTYWDVYGNWSGKIRANRLYNTGGNYIGEFCGAFFTTPTATDRVKQETIASMTCTGTGCTEEQYQRNEQKNLSKQTEEDCQLK